jgi:hypothetical protein
MEEEEGFSVYAAPAIRKIRRLLAEGVLTPQEARDQANMLRNLIGALARARSSDVEALAALDEDLAEQFKDAVPPLH